jgi:hypothetical protein
MNYSEIRAYIFALVCLAGFTYFVDAKLERIRNSIGYIGWDVDTIKERVKK